MAASRQAAILSLQQKREERRKEEERIAQEEIVSQKMITTGTMLCISAGFAAGKWENQATREGEGEEEKEEEREC